MAKWNKLTGNTVFRKLASNSLWLFVDKVLRLIMGLVVGSWVARYLGPENYGLLSYATAFVAISSSIATFGIDGLIVCELSKDENKDRFNEILGTAFWLRLIGGLISVIISIAAALFLGLSDGYLTIMIAIISIGNIFLAFDTIGLLYQAQVKSKYSVKAKFIAFIIVSILKVICILLNASVVVFAVLGLIEIVLGALGLLLGYKHSILDFKFSFKLMKAFLKLSWPILLSIICITIYMKSDQLILATFLGEEKLGIYSAAVRLSEICYFIPNVIISSVTPYLVNFHVADKEKYTKNIKKLFNSLVAVSYVLAIMISVLSPYIIKFLYGKTFIGADFVLSIHIWSLVFVSIGVAFRQVMIIEGNMSFLLLTTILGSISNVVLNLFFIPAYSFYGAVVSLVISQCIAGYLSTFLYADTRGLFYIQTRALLLLDFFPNIIKRRE